MRVVNEGERAGILLRLLGATAIMLHCPNYSYLFQKFGRSLTDLDFATYGKFRGKLEKFFVNLGYRSDRRTSYYFGESRHRYFDDANTRVVDIFFDKLSFCHAVPFDGRLELDSPTITLTDILLEKMQIVRINEKDIRDTIIMLREHQIQDGERESLNAGYVSKLLANDWGFYYTVTTNLNNVRSFLDKYEALTSSDRQDVASKINILLRRMEDEPKSMKWRTRAKIGTRKKWYTEVEDFRKDFKQ
jgi:hypothetical protein